MGRYNRMLHFKRIYFFSVTPGESSISIVKTHTKDKRWTNQDRIFDIFYCFVSTTTSQSRTNLSRNTLYIRKLTPLNPYTRPIPNGSKVL